MKVDFFIVGAPKAGTTSLYYYLKEHPEIEMSREKEPNYFSDKFIQNQGMYYGSQRIKSEEKYHSLFNKQDKEVIFGEASVSYLFFDHVAKNIKQYNAEAKIIIMLRNPIDRAFSHYLMDYRLGLINDSFESVINKKSKNTNASLFYQQYIEVSKYSVQVKRYLEEFDSDNILFIDYDDFKKDTKGIVRKVYSFLGVNTEKKSDVYKKHNRSDMPINNCIRFIYSSALIRRISSFLFARRIIEMTKQLLFKQENKPKLSKKTKIQLNEFFREDLLRLTDMIHKDFSKWIRLD